MVVVLEQLGNLLGVAPLDGSSLGHSVIESMMVKLKSVVIALVVAEEHLGVHLLLRGLPLTHIATADHPRHNNCRESDQESSEEQPGLTICLKHVPVTDTLSVIRQIEVILRQDLDKLIRTTSRSDGTSQRASEQTVARLPWKVDTVTITHTTLHSGTTTVVTREGNRSVQVRSVPAKCSSSDSEHLHF